MYDQMGPAQHCYYERKSDFVPHFYSSIVTGIYYVVVFNIAAISVSSVSFVMCFTLLINIFLNPKP